VTPGHLLGLTPGLPFALTPGLPFALTPGLPFGPHPCNSLCLGREPKARVATAKEKHITTKLINNLKMRKECCKK
jgi:hypothetical protein